jgi:hypothetical protein
MAPVYMQTVDTSDIHDDVNASSCEVKLKRTHKFT